MAYGWVPNNIIITHRILTHKQVYWFNFLHRIIDEDDQVNPWVPEDDQTYEFSLSV